MKALRFIAACVALLCVLASSASAQSNRKYFGGTSTDVGTNLTYFVAPVSNYGAPLITYLSATSDKSTSAMTFYTPTTSVDFSTTNLAGITNLNTIVGTAFASNDVVVIQTKLGDKYQRAVVWSASATNIVITTTNAWPIAVGDRIWRMSTVATRPVGAATTTDNGPGIFYGSPYAPLLIDLDGTSSCQINAAAGTYQP